MVVHKLPRDGGGRRSRYRDQSQAHTVSNDDGTKTTSQTIRAVVFGRGTDADARSAHFRSWPGRDSRASVPTSEGIDRRIGPAWPGRTSRRTFERQAEYRHADLGAARCSPNFGSRLIVLAGTPALCAVLVGYLLYRRFRGQDGQRHCPSSTHERLGRLPSTSSTASNGSTCLRMGGSRSTTPSLPTPCASTSKRCT